MDRDGQNTNGVMEVTTDNEEKKPEHVITAEISIEVTGADEPTKYDKRRKRWAVVALCSLIVLALSLISFFIVVNEYSFWFIVISAIVGGCSLVNAADIDPEEPTGHMPWYYGAL